MSDDMTDDEPAEDEEDDEIIPATGTDNAKSPFSFDDEDEDEDD